MHALRSTASSSHTVHLLSNYRQCYARQLELRRFASRYDSTKLSVFSKNKPLRSSGPSSPSSSRRDPSISRTPRNSWGSRSETKYQSYDSRGDYDSRGEQQEKGRKRKITTGKAPKKGLIDQSLRPAVLSEKIQELCRNKSFRKGYDLSMRLMRSAPNGTQSIEVWNTLMAKAYQAESYRLGYRAYLEV